ncbi:hypothetical protein LPB41_06840 [Thalassospira sp. MA62]|nr:hypothetical protein [Thalassospira sp. MA62]
MTLVGGFKTPEDSSYHGSSEWYDFIPGEELPRLIEYLAKSWQEILEAEARYIRSGKPPLAEWGEVDLTLHLTEVLERPQRRQQNGFSGRFIPEVQQYQKNAAGSVSIVGRTDIEYLMQGTATLTFECKWLDGSSAKRTLYGSQGVRRFVDGTYSPGADSGVMCGFLKPTAKDDPYKLAEYFEKKAQKFNSVAYSDGKYIQLPSLSSPHSHFDTTHSRNHGGPNIMLMHVFLTVYQPGE